MKSEGLTVRQKKLSVQISIWHRRAGLIAALFALVLAISGVLLNHSAFLGLDEQPLQSGMLVSLYSNQARAEPQYFSAGKDTVTQINDQLFYKTEPLWQNKQPLVGATENKKYLALAFSNELALFSHDGELLERMTYLPRHIAAIDRIGHDSSGRIALRGQGNIVIADADMLSWNDVDGKIAITWSQPLKAENVTDRPIIADQQFPELTWERLLLDLHSGRILGHWGPWLMDSMALAMVFLVFTGLWRWWKLQRLTRSR